MAPKDHVDPEEEYFHREEKEKLEKLKAQAAADAATKALAERKRIHFNKCGKCGADMQPQVFKGVEIDICSECGAVLLDPGELETLAGKDASGVFGVIGDLFSLSRKKKPVFAPEDDERLS